MGPSQLTRDWPLFSWHLRQKSKVQTTHKYDQVLAVRRNKMTTTREDITKVKKANCGLSMVAEEGLCSFYWRQQDLPLGSCMVAGRHLSWSWFGIQTVDICSCLAGCRWLCQAVLQANTRQADMSKKVRQKVSEQAGNTHSHTHTHTHARAYIKITTKLRSYYNH